MNVYKSLTTVPDVTHTYALNCSFWSLEGKIKLGRGIIYQTKGVWSSVLGRVDQPVIKDILLNIRVLY